MIYPTGIMRIYGAARDAESLRAALRTEGDSWTPVVDGDDVLIPDEAHAVLTRLPEECCDWHSDGRHVYADGAAYPVRRIMAVM